MTFTPDARSAAMGEAGVALSPDANATYWNASKLAFAERDFGVSASYAPWFRSITENKWLGYASAYKKLGDRQALAVSVNYFDKWERYLQSPNSLTGGEYSSSELAINGSYSRQLGKNFSIGITLKYISSNLSDTIVLDAISLGPARTIAGDLSAYYRKEFKNVTAVENFTWSVGAVVSNFGNKINYGSGIGENFLPTTLKIGTGLSFTTNKIHRFSFIADASKLMTPTPEQADMVVDKPLLKGIFGSFSDAPNGFREELQEVSIAVGAEYWYKDIFALRGGYHGENKYKGNRKFLTAGAGLYLFKNYGLDFAYLFPVHKDNVLSGTFRISASVYLGKSEKGI